MYSNIDSTHGIEVTHQFFDKFKNQLPPDCQTKFILLTLEIIMKENIFQFGDTYWLQSIGCAMYICGCKLLLHLHRPSRNIRSPWQVQTIPTFLLSIYWQHHWCLGPQPIQQHKKIQWIICIERLNNWEKFCLTSTGFKRSLQLMNLTISIINHNDFLGPPLHHCTFQKVHYLHLYIPPLSAHPKQWS